VRKQNSSVKAAENPFSTDKLTQIFAPLEGVPHIAIAVSGGGDSMALLGLALQWRGSGVGLTALTVDHALREASADEAVQVARWCQDLGVPHHTLSWQHDVITSAVQAKARIARYELMANWCKAGNVPVLLTAHTIEDQAETVAMRQQRTKSEKSLAGIWPETQWNGIRVLRPLLGQQRATLRQFLEAIGQSWLEDPSNGNIGFERVRIRRDAPPVQLAEIASASQSAITAARSVAEEWIKAELTIAPTGMINFAPPSFAALTPLVQDEVLLHLIALGGGASPELARRKALVAWLISTEAGRRTLGGVIFSKRKRQILVLREPARIAAAPRNLGGAHPILWDQRFHVTGPEGSTVSSMNAFKLLKRIAEIPAMVWAGLPVVSRGEEILGTVHGHLHPDVKIEFIKK
jgi:tRNA(Ile)-lysidine synthase